MTQKKAAGSAHKAAKAANRFIDICDRKLLSGNRGNISEQSLANLKPFKPGQSGNPSGRPKRDLSASMAEQIFEEHFEVIKRAMIAKLRKGDVKAFDALAARKWGKAHQQVDLTGQMNVSVVIDI